jgi:hypothetical protein
MIIRKDDLTSLIQHIREAADDLERIVNAPMEESDKPEDPIQLSDIRAVLGRKIKGRLWGQGPGSHQKVTGQTSSQPSIPRTTARC